MQGAVALGPVMMDSKSTCSSCNLPLQPAETPLGAGSPGIHQDHPAQLLSKDLEVVQDSLWVLEVVN